MQKCSTIRQSIILCRCAAKVYFQHLTALYIIIAHLTEIYKKNESFLYISKDFFFFFSATESYSTISTDMDQNFRRSSRTFAACLSFSCDDSLVLFSLLMMGLAK